MVTTRHTEFCDKDRSESIRSGPMSPGSGPESGGGFCPPGRAAWWAESRTRLFLAPLGRARVAARA